MKKQFLGLKLWILRKMRFPIFPIFAVLIGATMTVQKDVLVDGHYRITNDEGKIVGEGRTDPLFPDRIRFYDEHERLIGETRKDPILPNSWRIEIYKEGVKE